MGDFFNRDYSQPFQDTIPDWLIIRMINKTMVYRDFYVREAYRAENHGWPIIPSLGDEFSIVHLNIEILAYNIAQEALDDPENPTYIPYPLFTSPIPTYDELDAFRYNSHIWAYVYNIPDGMDTPNIVIDFEDYICFAISRYIIYVAYRLSMWITNKSMRGVQLDRPGATLY